MVKSPIGKQVEPGKDQVSPLHKVWYTINMNLDRNCKRGHKNWKVCTNKKTGQIYSICKDCDTQRSLEYQQRNKETRTTYVKDYREVNREKLKAYDRERNQSSERKLAMKASKLKHSYGLTLEQYYGMWEAQNNKCAICKKDLIEGKLGAHVDHDHTCCSGKTSCGKCIRGILCFDCNNGIERFKDNPALCREAALYLELLNA